MVEWWNGEHPAAAMFLPTNEWSSNFLLTAAVRALQTVATYCPMSGLPVRAGLGMTPPTAPLRSPVSPAPCCRFYSWHQPQFSFCGVQQDREGQSCVCTPACVLYFNSFGRTPSCNPLYFPSAEITLLNLQAKLQLARCKYCTNTTYACC